MYLDKVGQYRGDWGSDFLDSAELHRGYLLLSIINLLLRNTSGVCSATQVFSVTNGAFV